MIFEKIREIICEQLELSEEQVKPESDLIDDLGADSLDIVDLVMSLEDEFELEVPDNVIENMRTVADAVKFIEGNK